MINITYAPNDHKLLLEGHAGYSEEGKDIVCAAVSILFYTLAHDLEEIIGCLEGPAAKEIGKDGSSIACTPKKGYEGNVELIYWSIINGLQLLAVDYPDNISFKVVTL